MARKFLGDVISRDEAARRVIDYEKNSKGSFIFHDVRNSLGKRVW